MKISSDSRYRYGGYMLTAILACSVSGCKSGKPAVDDATLTRNSQAQINLDSSLSGQPIQVSVSGGVASLNGSVQNDAQKTIAARDVAGVNGVKEVLVYLNVGSQTPAQNPVGTASSNMSHSANPTVAVETAPLPAKVQNLHETTPKRVVVQPEPQRLQQRPAAPIERPQQAYNDPPPVYRAPAPAPAPLPPPPPAFHNVTLAAGNVLPVRVTETLDSATTQEGDAFSGVIASDVLVDGVVALPAGSAVSGRVDTVHEAAHFKGSSLLTVSLGSVTRRGDKLPIETEPYSIQGKGRGVNTAEKTGGGAAVGAILGGIFGGGKGAAIGAAAGGGVGAGSNAITRGQQVQIPSETVVRFRLSTPLTVKVRGDGGAAAHGDAGRGDALQPRN